MSLRRGAAFKSSSSKPSMSSTARQLGEHGIHRNGCMIQCAWVIWAFCELEKTAIWSCLAFTLIVKYNQSRTLADSCASSWIYSKFQKGEFHGTCENASAVPDTVASVAWQRWNQNPQKILKGTLCEHECIQKQHLHRLQSHVVSDDLRQGLQIQIEWRNEPICKVQKQSKLKITKNVRY